MLKFYETTGAAGVSFFHAFSTKRPGRKYEFRGVEICETQMFRTTENGLAPLRAFSSVSEAMAFCSGYEAALCVESLSAVQGMIENAISERASEC